MQMKNKIRGRGSGGFFNSRWLLYNLMPASVQRLLPCHQSETFFLISVSLESKWQRIFLRCWWLIYQLGLECQVSRVVTHATDHRFLSALGVGEKNWCNVVSWWYKDTSIFCDRQFFLKMLLHVLLGGYDSQISKMKIDHKAKHIPI